MRRPQQPSQSLEIAAILIGIAFLVGGGFICLLAQAINGMITQNAVPIDPDARAAESENFPLQALWWAKMDGSRIDLLDAGEQPVVALLGYKFWDSHLYVWEASTGDLLWSQSSDELLGSRVPRLPPVISGEQLLLTTGKSLHSFTLKTGVEQWHTQAYNLLWLTVTDMAVIAEDKESEVALDLATGERQWRTTYKEGAFSYDPFTNRLYARAHLGRVLIVDPVDGQVLERVLDAECLRGREGRIQPGKIYYDTEVCDTSTWKLIRSDESRTTDQFFPPNDPTTYYVRTHQGTVKAFTSEDERLQWEYVPSANDDDKVPKLVSAIVGIGETGYVVADDDTIRAFDLATGTEIGWWRKPSSLESGEVQIRSNGEHLFVIFGNWLYTFGRPPTSHHFKPFLKGSYALPQG